MNTNILTLNSYSLCPHKKYLKTVTKNQKQYKTKEISKNLFGFP